LPGPGEADRLAALNPHVSVGLADVVARCLAVRAEDRYPGAAALAADLRRHLADEPLRGGRNRPLAGRWRQRAPPRPHALRRLGLLRVAVAVAAGGLLYVFHQLGKAAAALEEGRQALRRGRHAEARGAFRHGLALAEDLPFGGDLVRQLHAGLRQAER